MEGIKKEIEDIEKQMSDPSFWSDLKKSQELSKKQKALKELLEEYESLLSRCEDLYTLIELGLEEGDESITEEVEREYKELKKEVENLKIRTLLSGPYDKNNAILSIHAGSGGTEAQDWAEMLQDVHQMG